ncbi:type II toxin-antitoxin system VapC family toxin [Glycomyces sp. L485]|uniref:type II toxin-antitoxin system VapC family toxin n=1 Tax=Glycomyces sp. L485 TaxID=2909235 RepID=UPI001F4AFA80|nr:type II toxin-antitoxin system VapC family toxin [Glycomyces sp. L485]
MARPDPPNRIYLDSCILIAYLNGEPHPDVPRLMKALLSGKYEAAVSGLHYVEVTKPRARPFDQEFEDRSMEMVEASCFKMIDLGPDIQIRARRYALHESLKPADAIHLAAAVVGECDVLMTLDGRLQSRYGQTRFVDGVWIDEVYLPWPETGALPGL